jgi:HSP20 family protein
VGKSSEKIQNVCVMAVTKISSPIHPFVHGSTGEPVTGRWAPKTDVYVAECGLVIKVELAGMKSNSLEITVEGQRLHIAGVRPDCCRAPHCNFLIMEISYGPFETVLDLPTGYDLGHAKAAYVNGFLRIDVPASHPAPSPKTKVPISEGN